MTENSRPATRRTVLAGAAALGGLPILIQANQARAAGTMPRANVKYQETPKDGAACAACTYYIPGASPKAAGECKLVAGSISPTAWCILFAPKPR